MENVTFRSVIYLSNMVTISIATFNKGYPMISHYSPVKHGVLDPPLVPKLSHLQALMASTLQRPSVPCVRELAGDGMRHGIPITPNQKCETRMVSMLFPHIFHVSNYFLSISGLLYP